MFTEHKIPAELFKLSLGQIILKLQKLYIFQICKHNGRLRFSMLIFILVRCANSVCIGKSLDCNLRYIFLLFFIAFFCSAIIYWTFVLYALMHVAFLFHCVCYFTKCLAFGLIYAKSRSSVKTDIHRTDYPSRRKHRLSRQRVGESSQKRSIPLPQGEIGS